MNLRNPVNLRNLVIADRYWVIGGRWVDDGEHLSWPRVYGPYPDYNVASASAGALNDTQDPNVRYLVVADVLDGPA